MAIFSSIALGKAKGSVGNVTFTVQRGQTIAKSKPVSVANPQTAKQTDQRSRFADASNFAKHIANFLELYHKPTSNKFSPRNSFMNSMLKLNLGALFTPANTAPLAILYANGPLSLPAFTHATAPAYNGIYVRQAKMHPDIFFACSVRIHGFHHCMPEHMGTTVFVPREIPS